MNKTAISIRLLSFVVILSVASLAFAGDLDAPAGPTDAGSAMFTLEDLYNRLNSGAQGTKRSGPFAEPSAAPGSTMHNLNDIMNKAPVVDNTAGAGAEHVLAGKTYWGLQSGKWGLQTGTLANVGAMNITPSPATQTITAGFHDGAGKVGGDADLVTGNIRAGVNLFGVDGNAAVVNTSSGNATAGELLYTRTAWANGQEVAGKLLGGVLLKAGGSFSPEKRWYDNADGTIVDVTTGMVWLKTLPTTVRPVLATSAAVIDAVKYACNLVHGTSGLTDGSRFGDWRVPTLREMQSLMVGPEAIGGGNLQGFSASTASTYWTMTQDVDYRMLCTIDISTGAVVGVTKITFSSGTQQRLVWPVRGALLP